MHMLHTLVACSLGSLCTILVALALCSMPGPRMAVLHWVAKWELGYRQRWLVRMQQLQQHVARHMRIARETDYEGAVNDLYSEDDCQRFVRCAEIKLAAAASIHAAVAAHI